MKDRSKKDQLIERIEMVAVTVLSACGLSVVIAITYRIVSWIV